MAFSGGGGGQITNHVHDNTPLQGGPLNMAGTTIGSLNAGSITYSDGAALQELIAPAVPAGEVLQFAPAATAPSWGTTGAGGAWNFKEEFVLSGDQQYFDCTFADPYVYADFAKLVLIYNLKASVTTGGMALAMRYAFSGTSYKTSDYFNIAIYNNNPDALNKIFWSAYDAVPLLSDTTVGQGVSNGMTVNGQMSFMDNVLSEGAGTTTLKPFFYETTTNAFNNYQTGAGFFESTSVPTELSSIRFTFSNDDFSTPAGTFEVVDGSTVQAWTVSKA